MTHGFKMTLDVSGETENIGAHIAATVRQLEVAAARAAVKVAQWLRTHSVRELGQELGVKQEPLKKRFKVYPRHSQGQVRLWVGLLPIAVHRLGQPKLVQGGVRVGSREYDGAFISAMNSDQPLVFRRVGRERLSIELVEEDVSEDMLGVLERWERRVTVHC